MFKKSNKNVTDNKSDNNINKKSLHKVGNIFANIVLVSSILFLCLCGYTAFQFKANPEDAYVLGYKPIYVKTGSMEPTMMVNSVAIVKETNYDDVKVNDIIVYQIEDKMIVHRVVEKTDAGIKTKGDNNNSNDAYLLSEKNVKAKVLTVWNWTAQLVREIQTPFGIIKWIGFPIFSIIILILLFKVVIPKIKSLPEEDDSDSSKVNNDKFESQIIDKELNTEITELDEEKNQEESIDNSDYTSTKENIDK